MDIKKIIELHAKWSRGDADGVRADLSGAYLRRTNLCFTNLRLADLSGANIRFADLSGADLSGAELSEAFIFDTVGDGKIIRTMQLPRYTVVVREDWLQIGCEGHRVHEWKQFDDGTIAKMDDGALEWWTRHRDIVMAFVEAGN